MSSKGLCFYHNVKIFLLLPGLWLKWHSPVSVKWLKLNFHQSSACLKSSRMLQLTDMSFYVYFPTKIEFNCCCQMQRGNCFIKMEEICKKKAKKLQLPAPNFLPFPSPPPPSKRKEPICKPNTYAYSVLAAPEQWAAGLTQGQACWYPVVCPGHFTPPACPCALGRAQVISHTGLMGKAFSLSTISMCMGGSMNLQEAFFLPDNVFLSSCPLHAGIRTWEAKQWTQGMRSWVFMETIDW